MKSDVFFRKLALVQWIYLLAVILYGAVVRATRSGAGCGANWPLCNGEILPQLSSNATLIEFMHRLTSGICLPFGLFILWQAYQRRAKVPLLYLWAWSTVVFIIIEALIGASLVLLEHVAYNTSGYRVITMSAHLLSSNFLLASALLTWHLSAPRFLHLKQCGRLSVALIAGAGILLAVNFSGAFTVLADSLFPSDSVTGSIRSSLIPDTHLFVRLRVFHPFFAMFGAAIVVALVQRLVRDKSEMQIYPRVLVGLFCGQAAFGLSNILFPGTLPCQIGHLLGAELIWLWFVLFIWDASCL